MQKVLVAGATGTLGRHLVERLGRDGYRVRALGRRPDALASLGAPETAAADLTRPGTLSGVCDGVSVVFSCAGASMSLTDLRDRKSFMAVDFRGNERLLAEAMRAGVEKFVYVSVFGADRLPHTEYARAHERFASALKGSGLPHTIVRPTGYFSFFSAVLRAAEQGQGVVLGSGEARTNPIHEADLAERCLRALEEDAPEVDAGGPETFTRREIVELALEAAGRPKRILRLPPRLMDVVGAALYPLNPRLSALMRFGAAVSVTDAVAPAFGSRRLRDYFMEVQSSRFKVDSSEARTLNLEP